MDLRNMSLLQWLLTISIVLEQSYKTDKTKNIDGDKERKPPEKLLIFNREFKIKGGASSKTRSHTGINRIYNNFLG